MSNIQIGSFEGAFFEIGAQFLPDILDANLCKNKQTNNKLTNQQNK